MEEKGTEAITILVTLDGSHFSEAILGTVLRIAGPLDATVELLRVARPGVVRETPSARSYGEMTPSAASSGARLTVPLPSAQRAPIAESREQALDRREAELRDYLRDRAAELAGVPATIAVTFDDDPARAIIAHARRIRPSLIAMATHGRTGLGHMLAGSVCEAVIRSGVAPVLVLRP